MRYFFHFVLACCFFVFNLHAMDAVPLPEKIIDALISGDSLAVQKWRTSVNAGLQKTIIENASLLDVSIYINNLLQNREKPDSILLILDNDGTLTRSKTPSDNVQQRGQSTKMVKKLLKAGVHIVVSSAFDDFETTLTTLQELEIADNLLVNENEIIEIKSADWPHVQGFMSGLVCSLRYPDKICDRYFRQKALTPFFTHCKESISGYRWVIFADDSKVNVHLFNSDIEKLGLQPNTVIIMFSLDAIQNEPDWPKHTKPFMML